MDRERQRSASHQSRGSYQTRTYIDGNTVRRVHYQAVPDQEPYRERTRQRRRGTQARRNRQRAMQMNIGYVAFLTAAAVATLFISVNYLKLQARATALRSELTSLESDYSSLKLANDENYARVLSDVDLEDVRDTAINKLGMVYAVSGQVVTYDDQEGDYVRQYQDVPEE